MIPSTEVPSSQLSIANTVNRLGLITSKAALDNSRPFESASSTYVNNRELRNLLEQHSMLHGTEDELLDLTLAKKEIVLLEQLKKDRSFHRNEIIFEYRVLRSICLLQRSTELLPKVLGNFTFGKISSFDQRRPELRPTAADGRLCSSYFDGYSSTQFPCSSSFET